MVSQRKRRRYLQICRVVAIFRCVPFLTGDSSPLEFLGIDLVTHFGKIMGGSFVYSPARGIIASNLVYYACQATLPYHDGTPEIPLAAGAPIAAFSVTFLNEATGTNKNA